MADFIKEYFIEPIYTGTGYNIVNTIVYGLLLGVGIILSYKIIERFKVRIDEKFLLGLLPFLILGSVLRALEDALLLPKSAFLITPGIFFTIFGIVIFALIISAFLHERKGYELHTTLGILGLLLLPYPGFLVLKNILLYSPLLYAASALIASTAVFIGAIKYLNISYMQGWWVTSIIAAHMLDASTTVVAVDLYGYWEEHYFEGALVDALGTGLIIYPLKAAVLFTAVYIVQKAVEDENALSYWYLALFILGFSPGMRNLLKLMLVG